MWFDYYHTTHVFFEVRIMYFSACLYENDVGIKNWTFTSKSGVFTAKILAAYPPSMIVIRTYVENLLEYLK